MTPDTQKTAAETAAGATCVGFLLGVFVIAPLFVAFVWNTGVGSIAHVHHIHHYWSAVALGLAWSVAMRARH